MLPIVPEIYLDPIITPATSLAYKRKHLPNTPRTSDYRGKVFSEKRKKDTYAPDYAEKTTKQIKKLINKGVNPNNITVIGTSKGGYIAQFVSTLLANPNVNFVFIFVNDGIHNSLSTK